MSKPLYTERDWIPALRVVDMYLKHAYKVGLTDGKDVMMKIAEDGKSVSVVVSGFRVPHEAKFRFINPDLTFNLDILNFENSSVQGLFFEDEMLLPPDEIQVIELILELEE